MPTGLDQELATSDRERKRLLAEAPGKYVLIKGEEVIGTFESQNDAIDEGWRRFGRVPILTKKIVAFEKPIYVPHVRA